jgi:HEAT repeat protein
VYIGKEACQVYEFFDLLCDENHYYEGSIGPVWIHFVLTGDLETISYMLNSGAEVYTEAILLISFSALEAARALGDERMIQLLKQYTDDQ